MSERERIDQLERQVDSLVGIAEALTEHVAKLTAEVSDSPTANRFLPFSSYDVEKIRMEVRKLRGKG